MRWKWIVGVGVLLIIALMVTVYMLLATYDYNNLKPRIAQLVKDATGRKLNLSGEVNLDFGFSPALVVTDVTFTNASWGSQPEMIRIGKLQAQVRLLPLLFRDVELRQMGLTGVEVLLETDPSGRGNWDLMAGDSSDKRGRSFKPAQIDINNIRIENLSLTLRDGKTGSAKALSLQNSQGRVGRGGLRLSLDGSIKNLIAFTGIDVRFKGSGMDLSEVGPVIGEKLPTTDNFVVQGWMAGSAKALSLREVKGSVSRGSLNLTFNGGIKELFALEGINFKLKAIGKELAEIGPLVGTNLPKLGPFDVISRLSGSVKSISLSEFSAMVDKSDFNGLAKVEFFERPKITVRLESSVIDFTTLMKSLEKDEQKPANKDKQKRRLFSDDPLPFDALNKVDADIVLKAKNIHAKDAHLEFGHLTLILENSKLSIDKLEATYKKTKISGNLQINPGAPTQMGTNFLVQNFNLGDFLKETGKSDQIRAIVDIAAHGKSNGESVHALMANLNGAFGAVMGPGYLTKYLDLLSMDLSQKVIPIWGSHQKAGEINCAVVQFDIKKGVATSQAFVFDSQIGVLTAEGDIRLGTEQVNFLLVPKPKNPGLLSLSTKLRVSGTLMDPKVKPDMLSLATKGAKVLSTLAIGPVGLLAPFVHLGAHKKHPCDIQSIGQLGLQIKD